MYIIIKKTTTMNINENPLKVTSLKTQAALTKYILPFDFKVYVD